MQTRVLGRQVLDAEAAATAKSALRIKELQDFVQHQELEILDLGKQLGAKEDEYDKRAEQINVLFSVSIMYLVPYRFMLTFWAIAAI